MRLKSILLVAVFAAACDPSASAPQANQTDAAEQPAEAAVSDASSKVPGPDDPATLYGEPWQAELLTGYDYPTAERKGRPQWDVAHRCGGAYIAPHWILTAGHCFDNQPWEKYHWRIRLGARDLTTGEGVTFRIDRVVPNPEFRHITYPSGKAKDSYINDVALAHFVVDDRTRKEWANRGQSKHVKMIRLNGARPDDTAIKAGDWVTVGGWGKTEDRDDAPTNPHLEAITIRAVPCTWSPDIGDKTDAGNLCAYGRKQDTCKGDSGGPMVRAKGEPVLVGIVSWGIGCADKYPGVYVRIDRDHYYDWIDREVGGLPPPKK
jgi:secreted trypsin-like serine protease